MIIWVKPSEEWKYLAAKPDNLHAESISGDVEMNTYISDNW